MEISPIEYDNIEDYINKIIMIPDLDGGLYSFYRIIRMTEKMACLKKMRDETILKKTYIDEDDNTETKVYEAKIIDDYQCYCHAVDKMIRKTNIKKYRVPIVSIVQYEI